MEGKLMNRTELVSAIRDEILKYNPYASEETQKELASRIADRVMPRNYCTVDCAKPGAKTDKEVCQKNCYNCKYDETGWLGCGSCVEENNWQPKETEKCTCKQCGGSGTVIPLKSEDEQSVCPKCGGSGLIDDDVNGREVKCDCKKKDNQ
jgi:hypothetical protein